jgi:hypothetical protein
LDVIISSIPVVVERIVVSLEKNLVVVVSIILVAVVSIILAVAVSIIILVAVVRIPVVVVKTGALLARPISVVADHAAVLIPAHHAVPAVPARRILRFGGDNIKIYGINLLYCKKLFTL